MTVKLKEDRKKATKDVIADLRKQLAGIPGAMARPQQEDIVTQIMTGGNQNLEVDIFGNDLAVLSRLSKDVMQRLRGISGLENLDVNWQEAMPEIQWKVDRQKAQELGLSFSDIANTINTATNGTDRQLLPGGRLPVSDHRAGSREPAQDGRRHERACHQVGFGTAGQADSPQPDRQPGLRDGAQRDHAPRPAALRRCHRSATGPLTRRNPGGYPESHDRVPDADGLLLGLGHESEAKRRGVRRDGPSRSFLPSR